MSPIWGMLPGQGKERCLLLGCPAGASTWGLLECLVRCVGIYFFSGQKHRSVGGFYTGQTCSSESPCFADHLLSFTQAISNHVEKHPKSLLFTVRYHSFSSTLFQTAEPPKLWNDDSILLNAPFFCSFRNTDVTRVPFSLPVCWLKPSLYLLNYSVGRNETEPLENKSTSVHALPWTEKYCTCICWTVYFCRGERAPRAFWQSMQARKSKWIQLLHVDEDFRGGSDENLEHLKELMLLNFI